MKLILWRRKTFIHSLMILHENLWSFFVTIFMQLVFCNLRSSSVKVSWVTSPTYCTGPVCYYLCFLRSYYKKVLALQKTDVRLAEAGKEQNRAQVVCASFQTGLAKTETKSIMQTLDSICIDSCFLRSPFRRQVWFRVHTLADNKRDTHALYCLNHTHYL